MKHYLLIDKTQLILRNRNRQISASSDFHTGQINWSKSWLQWVPLMQPQTWTTKSTTFSPNNRNWMPIEIIVWKWIEWSTNEMVRRQLEVARKTLFSHRTKMSRIKNQGERRRAFVRIHNTKQKRKQKDNAQRHGRSITMSFAIWWAHRILLVNTFSTLSKTRRQFFALNFSNQLNTRTDDTGAKHTFSFYENRCKWVDRRLSNLFFFQDIVRNPFDEGQWRKKIIWEMIAHHKRHSTHIVRTENTAEKWMSCLQVCVCFLQYAEAKNCTQIYQPQMTMREQTDQRNESAYLSRSRLVPL